MRAVPLALTPKRTPIGATRLIRVLRLVSPVEPALARAGVGDIKGNVSLRVASAR